ncbi:MAG: hypothetical protein WAV73_02290 [Candidatus Moraniibacteriota bacterium]
MNKNYKKTFASLVAFGVLFSTNAWAVGGNGGTAQEDRAARQADMEQKKDDRVAQKNDNICEKISERADAFGQKMSEEENKFQTRNQERLANWTTKKTEKEATLSSNRASWDANRDAQFKALEERAQTEEQKKAVADFETTTRAAIEARRLASDSAIKTFQDGIQAAITTRNGQVDQLLASAKEARQKLLDTAKADCAAGKDAKTVMANFRSGMQASRAKTQTDKQNVTKVNTQVQALIATRKASMDKAFSDFKATMEKARVALKKAFPTETETTGASD